MFPESSWFPEHMDWNASAVLFRKIDVRAFETVPFHDGRHDFLEGPITAVPLGKPQLRTNNGGDKNRPRMILHQSFCGSTFLARLLACGGKVASYREPQVLIELWQGPDSNPSFDLVKAILGHFSAGPRNGQLGVVKPSNWVNLHLLRSGVLDHCDVVLVEMSLEDYLVANLRGGNSRIRYSLNLLNHLLPLAPHWQSSVSQAQALLQTNGLQATLHLLAILHLIQAENFDQISDLPDANVMRLSHHVLRESPIVMAQKCSEILNLKLTADDLSRNAEFLSGQHAKSLRPDQFSQTKEAKINAAILQRFETEINEASMWAAGEKGKVSTLTG